MSSVCNPEEGLRSLLFSILKAPLLERESRSFQKRRRSSCSVYRFALEVDVDVSNAKALLLTLLLHFFQRGLHLRRKLIGRKITDKLVYDSPFAVYKENSRD